MVGEGVGNQTPSQKELQAGLQGIGRDPIKEVLGDLISRDKIDQQLANLNTSGHYTRIINEVAARVETEAKEQEEAARVATEKARGVLHESE